MLSLELTDFLVELKDGAISNAGGPTKSATIKLYDVTTAEARTFGDKRIKLAFADADDNEVEVALFPEQIEGLEADLASVEDTGWIEGFGAEEP